MGDKVGDMLNEQKIILEKKLQQLEENIDTELKTAVRVNEPNIEYKFKHTACASAPAEERIGSSRT